ncbi:MAG: AraC family transcriptional regulator [Thermodesulfobacteriota bacterium]
MNMSEKEIFIECPEDPWAPVDPLGEALHNLHMTVVFYARSEFTAPWGLDLPSFDDTMMFHVVTSGSSWVEVEGAEPVLLKPGDFALVPHGRGHQLLCEPGADCAGLFDVPRVEYSDRYEVIKHGGGGEPTSMICGVVRFDDPAARNLVDMLPRIIFIEAWRTPQMEWIQSTLKLMAAEASEIKPGGETIITRLADIMIIQAIRAWMAEDPITETGWLGALRDKEIGHAILLIQRNPEKAWTVESLAREVAMSRSAFAAKFKELVGETPMNYVARWKMNLALNWLKQEGATVNKLANRLGYQSEAAFSRAFKRYIGSSPGSVKRAM